MRVLSMTQPWASIVTLGLKAHETRNRQVSYRGLLLIHATKTPDTEFLTSPTGRKYSLNDLWPQGQNLPLGSIIGSCNLADCQPTFPLPTNLSETDYDFGDWSPGRYAWQLDNVTEFKKPIPCRGQPILWEPAPDITARVLEVLADETLHIRRPPNHPPHTDTGHIHPGTAPRGA